jgi:SAM-dependent methyltransferase
MKQILKHPEIYQLYQEFGGFFGARVKAIRDYLPIRAGERVIDIGCGPGHIVRHLPAGIDYAGFDIDGPSIAYARRRFGAHGRFEQRLFDAAAVREFGPADLVMMNGVMHHIDDAVLAALLADIRAVLKPGGRLFTLDGAYAPGQSRVAKWLLDNDRGVHVRSAEGYRRLLEEAFGAAAMHVRSDYSRMPYTFAIGVAGVPAEQPPTGHASTGHAPLEAADA